MPDLGLRRRGAADQRPDRGRSARVLRAAGPHGTGFAAAARTFCRARPERADALPARHVHLPAGPGPAGRLRRPDHGPARALVDGVDGDPGGTAGQPPHLQRHDLRAPRGGPDCRPVRGGRAGRAPPRDSRRHPAGLRHRHQAVGPDGLDPRADCHAGRRTDTAGGGDRAAGGGPDRTDGDRRPGPLPGCPERGRSGCRRLGDRDSHQRLVAVRRHRGPGSADAAGDRLRPVLRPALRGRGGQPADHPRPGHRPGPALRAHDAATAIPRTSSACWP